MKFITLIALASGIATLVACGGSNSNNNPNNNSNSTTCNSTHQCVNGDCECTTSGLSGTSCEESSCEDTCEVCSS